MKTDKKTKQKYPLFRLYLAKIGGIYQFLKSLLSVLFPGLSRSYFMQIRVATPPLKKPNKRPPAPIKILLLKFLVSDCIKDISASFNAFCNSID